MLHMCQNYGKIKQLVNFWDLHGPVQVREEVNIKMKQEVVVWVLLQQQHRFHLQVLQEQVI